MVKYHSAPNARKLLSRVLCKLHLGCETFTTTRERTYKVSLVMCQQVRGLTTYVYRVRYMSIVMLLQLFVVFEGLSTLIALKVNFAMLL